MSDKADQRIGRKELPYVRTLTNVCLLLAVALSGSMVSIGSEYMTTLLVWEAALSLLLLAIAARAFWLMYESACHEIRLMDSYIETLLRINKEKEEFICNAFGVNPDAYDDFGDRSKRVD